MTQKKIHARLELVFVNGKLIRKSLARQHAARATRARRAMHRQKIIGSELHPFPSSRINYGSPRGLGDAFPGLPLLDGPTGFPNGFGHLGNGIPEPEDVLNGFHNSQNTQDSLSRQGGTTPPMTATTGGRTICPEMGTHATTPKEFKTAFAKRLRAARALKYEQASDFAADLRIPPNTYGKYESGRSLMPHHLIPRACELLGISIETLFEFEKKARKAA